MSDGNVWADAWDETEDWSGGGAPGSSRVASASARRCTSSIPRPDGAHALRNETDEPVRYVVASPLGSPESAECPDLAQITAQARTASLTGERLWVIHDVPKAE